MQKVNFAYVLRFIYLYNLSIPYPYDPQIERTMRFLNTYFQNCISEWNWLDVSERSSPCILCVQYRGVLSSMGGIQYHGGYLEYSGVFSTMENILINVGDI